MEKVKYSLKYKILVVLVSIPLISLAAYFILVSQLFESDKKLYVYDSSLQMAKSLASQVRLEIETFETSIQPILNEFDLNTGRFSDLAHNYFKRQKKIEHLYVYKSNPKSEEFSNSDSLLLFPRIITHFKIKPERFNQLFKILEKKKFMILEYNENKNYFVVGLKLKNPVTKAQFVVVSLYRSKEIYESFLEGGNYKKYLISQSGLISASPKIFDAQEFQYKKINIQFFDKILNQKLPEGVFEVSHKELGENLVSFSALGKGDLLISIVVNKVKAMKALETLIYKSILFYLVIIFLVAILGLVVSVHLTSHLKKLSESAERIANGEFDINPQVNTSDEVGALSKQIQSMAKSISELIKAKSEQTRMEEELKLVNMLQENIFPPPKAQIKDFTITSFFQPATNCGGDWYHYYVFKNKLYLLIGDSTGHGAGAAVITAAAKTGSSLIEDMKLESPKEMLKVMNRAIRAAGNGQILMTFFLAQIDLDTGLMIYSSASHEIPLIFEKKKNLKRKNIITLTDANAARLGEFDHTDYPEGSYQLSAGDIIVLYTDGIFDLMDPEGKALGERRFIKDFISEVNKNTSLENKVTNTQKKLNEWRKNAPLADDLMLFACQYKA